MVLSDANIRWMRYYGISAMQFDDAGNVITIALAGTPDYALKDIEAPSPVAQKPMTMAEIRAEARRQQQAEKDEAERLLYAAVGGSPFKRDQAFEDDAGNAAAGG